jgi:excisionase family DNA binding protein
VTPDLITVREAAGRAGVSYRTLYRWLERDDRPDFFVKIGCRWKVSVPRLEQYLHGVRS